ncbi:methyltransferase domain-containing protein [Methylosinus sporium]|uniref:Protein-L-isoaspartate O-methyltransferase n=1 Tax=Methylosinus sporium TaxID=428 RepID=A0A549SFW1_METSR|nr:methyltransferase domain-containing protein [Methylosinus sporium]
MTRWYSPLFESEEVAALLQELAEAQIDLVALRRVYARQLLARAGISENKALEAAFAAIPRETFLVAPPWELLPVYFNHRGVTTDDPALLYQDVLVSLQGHRRVNNGCPALHAALLNAVGVRPGERVAHIGAGTGYYTAILAHLVGPTGQVTAVEFDAELAGHARTALAAYSNVSVVHDDGSKWPQQQADVIYVNFGVNRPSDAWIEYLADDGRLMFPLTASASLIELSGKKGGVIGKGPAFLVTRAGERFAAKSIGPVAIVQAEGDLVTAKDNERLAATLKKRTASFVRSLKWRKPILAPERYWYIGAGWALGFDEP